MARTVVLNMQLHGHVNPTLAVVQELVARGEEVIYYSSDTFKARIEQTGAAYRPYNTLFTDPALQAHPVDFSLLVIKECLHVLPQVLDEVRAAKPDYIIYESLCVTGRFLAQILNLPAIMLCSSHGSGTFTMAQEPRKALPTPVVMAHHAPDPASNEPLKDVLLMHGHAPGLVPLPSSEPPKDVLLMHGHAPGLVPQTMHSQQIPAGTNPVLAGPTGPEYIPADQIAEVQAAMHAALTELCATYGLPPIEPSNIHNHVEELNIVFLPRAFQPRSETFDERFVFVGPSIAPQAETASPVTRAADRPTLYISLGTLFNDWPEFFAICCEAFGNSQWQVVMAIGDRVDPARLGALPDNITVAPYVPQLAVLANTDVFITHGGMNSTMEALAYGVPLVIIPQMAEQAVTARRVAELGLGLALDKFTVTAEMLRDAAARVLNDPGFHEQTAQMQAAIREAGGYKRAADVIIQFTTANLKARSATASRI